MIRLSNYTSKYRAKLISDVYKKWIKNGDSIIDVGCGNGIVTSELKDNLSINVTGCDIDNYLVADIPYKRMKSFSKIPFPNKKFDGAFFNDVLHHTDYSNQRKLLEEAARVSHNVYLFELKPTVVGRAGDFLLNKIHHFKMKIPFTYRTEREWDALFKELGFSYSKIHVERPVFYPFTHIAYKLRRI